jgi:PX domain
MAVQAFHTYKVRTKTSQPQYRNRSMEVVRRFRDFAWLHQRLSEHNRGGIEQFDRHWLLAACADTTLALECQ